MNRRSQPQTELLVDPEHAITVPAKNLSDIRGVTLDWVSILLKTGAAL